MDLLNVALQIVAIIAIIAVGAFIIVFLSDLLISVIDDHKGIFFRRGKSKDTDYNDSYISNKSRVNTPTLILINKKLIILILLMILVCQNLKKKQQIPLKKVMLI